MKNFYAITKPSLKQTVINSSSKGDFFKAGGNCLYSHPVTKWIAVKMRRCLSRTAWKIRAIKQSELGIACLLGCN